MSLSIEHALKSLINYFYKYPLNKTGKKTANPKRNTDHRPSRSTVTLKFQQFWDGIEGKKVGQLRLPKDSETIVDVFPISRKQYGGSQIQVMKSKGDHSNESKHSSKNPEKSVEGSKWLQDIKKVSLVSQHKFRSDFELTRSSRAMPSPFNVMTRIKWNEYKYWVFLYVIVFVFLELLSGIFTR